MIKNIVLACGLLGAIFVAIPAAIAQQAPSTITAYSLRLDSGAKTVTAAGGLATLNKASGVVTTEALSTASAATYTLTLTDNAIGPNDLVFASVGYGSATAGTPTVARVTPSAGAVTITVQNIHATVAVNGTLRIAFMVLKN